jgi:hypothetical protein
MTQGKHLCLKIVRGGRILDLPVSRYGCGTRTVHYRRISNRRRQETSLQLSRMSTSIVINGSGNGILKEPWRPGLLAAM